MVILALVIPIVNCMLISTGNWEQILVLLIMSIYSDSDEKLSKVAFASLSTVTMIGLLYLSPELILLSLTVWWVTGVFKLVDLTLR